MKKRLLLLFLCGLSAYTSAQNVKGMYVNGFSTILGNTAREDSLLRFAENNGFNYLTLYEMHTVHANTPLTNTSSAQVFADFVAKAKTQYGITEIGVASENFNALNNVIHVYNQQHASPNEKVDVYNLEFEFWTSATEPGGYYCDTYLQPNGFSCDTAGGFAFFRETLHRVDSIAALDGARSEAYFGWFNDGQGAQIVQTGVDRVLVSAYVPSASYSAAYQYNYLTTRLQRLASANTAIKLLPLYSAETDFMHDWAVANPFFQPYTDLVNSLASETGAWEQYIVPEGIQWFAYSYLPKKNMDLSVGETSAPVVRIYPNPARGSFSISAAEPVLSVTVRDAYGTTVRVSEKADGLQLPQGVYFVNVQIATGTHCTKLTVL